MNNTAVSRFIACFSEQGWKLVKRAFERLDWLKPW